MRTILCFFLMMAALQAQTPALKDQPLTAIKGSMQIPDGWFFKEEAEDGVFVYQVSREKAEEGAQFLAGLTLSVTTKVPERASMKASEYAADLMTPADGGKLETSDEGDYKVFRSEYTIESDGGNVQVVNFAKANDKTGTLYFVSWQSPDADQEKLAPLREQILKSMKLDPAF